MDTVVRRQSEHLENVENQNRKPDEFFNLKSWEWTFLRVSDDLIFIFTCAKLSFLWLY